MTDIQMSKQAARSLVVRLKADPNSGVAVRDFADALFSAVNDAGIFGASVTINVRGDFTSDKVA